jgi:hypothetical protein
LPLLYGLGLPRPLYYLLMIFLFLNKIKEKKRLKKRVVAKKPEKSYYFGNKGET